MQQIRRQKITEVIREKGSAKISELASLFGTSEITIHRDLNFLERKGVLRKLRGGAVANPLSVEVNYPYRLSSCSSEKMQIAKTVASLISEGDSLILDGSTTSRHVAREIKEINNITVFTTSPLVLLELINCPGIILCSTGGLYSRELAHFIGTNMEEYISRLHVSKCVIGASAISSEFGVTGPYPQLVSIHKKIITASSQVILAADHTKFGKVALEKVSDIEEIDIIVVDSSIEEKYVYELKGKTKMIIAK